MTLREQIGEQLTAAMRSGDVLRRDTLRMATNAAYNAEKRQQRPLTEEELVSLLAREVKTRRESVEAFRAGGRRIGCRLPRQARRRCRADPRRGHGAHVGLAGLA